MRAGQPLYGPKHRRCRPDEAILNTIVNVGMKGVIYDLRSSNSISQQQNKGIICYSYSVNLNSSLSFSKSSKKSV